jgi:predicted aspartyl protease
LALAGPSGKKATVTFLVDSGAKYTLLSESEWKSIELVPSREMTFMLADGTPIKRNIPDCFISLSQGESHRPVILGEAGDEPLLGIITLEILGLTLSPFNRILQPMRNILHPAVSEQ